MRADPENVVEGCRLETAAGRRDELGSPRVKKHGHDPHAERPFHVPLRKERELAAVVVEVDEVEGKPAVQGGDEPLAPWLPTVPRYRYATMNSPNPDGRR